MEKLLNLIKKGEVRVIVNFPFSLEKIKNNNISLINKKKNRQDITLKEMFESFSEARVEQVFKLVHLDYSLKFVSLKYLTNTEYQKVLIAYSLLNKKNIFIIDHFFQSLIYEEVKYFEWLFRNLVQKQNLAILLLEDNMDFICEYFRKLYLYDGNEFKLIVDFYDEILYKNVLMPKTVELIVTIMDFKD